MTVSSLKSFAKTVERENLSSDLSFFRRYKTGVFFQCSFFWLSVVPFTARKKDLLSVKSLQAFSSEGDLEKLSLSLDAAPNKTPPAQCSFSAPFGFPWMIHCLSVVLSVGLVLEQQHGHMHNLAHRKVLGPQGL